jgi:phosphatidylglycerophosphatase A
MSFYKHIATLGLIGYLPAPGTCGTLVALPLALALACLPFVVQNVVILAFVACSIYCIQQALPSFTTSDPKQIVLDEVVGCLVTFFAVPLKLPYIVTGFCLFRILDIYKPFGLKKLERLSGAWGVVADDLGAGVISNIVLHSIIKFF